MKAVMDIKEIYTEEMHHDTLDNLKVHSINDTLIPFEIEYPEEAQTLMTICKERGKRKYEQDKRLKPMYLGAEPIKAGVKIRRNDPCSCGSEKIQKMLRVVV